MMVCQLRLESLIFMPVKTFRPLTPSQRYVSFADFSDITKFKPEKSLVEIRKKTGGRNHFGRATARGIGGGQSRKSAWLISSATSTAWKRRSSVSSMTRFAPPVSLC